MKKYRIVGELADNGAVYYKVQERKWFGWKDKLLNSSFVETMTPSILCAERTLRRLIEDNNDTTMK